jgi:hypothetical protein
MGAQLPASALQQQNEDPQNPASPYGNEISEFSSGYM